MRHVSDLSTISIQESQESQELQDLQDLQELQTNDDVCSICLREFKDFHINDICKLQCNHLFCEACVKKLLETRRLTPPLCPLCRVPIKSYTYKRSTHYIIPIYRDQIIETHNIPRGAYILSQRKIVLLYMFGCISIISLSMSMIHWYNCAYASCTKFF